VLSSDGTEVKLPRAHKDEIADAIWDLLAARLG
jgi:phosphopantothenoylcysteine synthetase/decarboxylase